MDDATKRGGAAGVRRFGLKKMSQTSSASAASASRTAPQINSCELSTSGAAAGVHSSRPINRGAFSGRWPGLALPDS